MMNPFDTKSTPQLPEGVNTPSAGQAQNTGVAGPTQAPAGKFTGNTNYQSIWDQALKDQGWAGQNANQYRGGMQPILDYIKQQGGGDWQQGGAKADDWIKDPSGAEWDMITSGGQWMDQRDYTNTGGGPAGTNPSGAPSGLGYSPWSADPRESGLFNQLLSRAGQSLTPSPNDPVIANQVNAYRANAERGKRDYLSGLAERQGPNANMSMESRMGAEQVAQQTGGMQAQLMQNEVNARRQEIQNALSQMGGMLSTDQQLALQKELAYLSNDQFLRQFGLQAGMADQAMQG